MAWEKYTLGVLRFCAVALLLLLAVAFGLGVLTGRATAQDIPRAALQYRGELTRVAHAVWGLDAPVPLFAAQIHQESGWNPAAVSKVGAQGMAQFMPATARWWCGLRSVPAQDCTPTNPTWAMRALVEYDLWLFQRVYGDSQYDRLWATFRSYNGGLGHWQQEAATVRPVTDRVAIDAACGNARRSAIFCPENVGYPRRIMQALQPRYGAWGPEVRP